MVNTAGDRLYLIRLACGDGVRDAEPLDAFAKRVKAATGRNYSAMTVSLLERMKQKWRLEDVSAFAAVDPLGRGEAWLSGFGEPSNGARLDPRTARKFSEEELDRAERKDAADRSEQAHRARGAGRRRRP